MIIQIVLFVIVTIKTYYSFHINYKILPKNKYNKNYTRKVQSVNYMYKYENTKSRKFKNKILSFFSNYFTDENDKYTLKEEEYLKMLGTTDSDDFKDLVKSHEEFLKTCSDIKSKLKYKDIFFFITQKIIKKNLHDFKRKQKFNIFGKDEYTSELSIDYIKSSNIEERIKEQMIKKLSDEMETKRYFLLRIFKWKGILNIINISTLMLPISFIGLLLSKMGLFSVAVNMLLTAHFLTFNKDQKKNMKASTLLLTLLPIVLHTSLGTVCSNIFLKYYKFNLPAFVRTENVLSFFINIQLYIASLIYFINYDNEVDTEQINDNFKNDYIDFNNNIPSNDDI
ncbi:conserved Plasmodium protein, unknown function [Plasmodium malariae]|uniref:Uncharacterized protein n=1 Tax=Plasmodium malariae TaxID=5858 RepID=A0A1C3L2T9_PLAMA|nr:conserved Plasmodium protein, unknown function [Plasmodium malariae]